MAGETLREAQFEGTVGGYLRWVVSGFMAITAVGIPFIPFWLLFSLWYVPAYLQRLSARLTPDALEVTKGVFFRSEATIPLNRITDVRLYDGPLMRAHKLRGMKVETAGQSSETSSEGKLIGVVGVMEFRNAVLQQRQQAVAGEQPKPAAAPPSPQAADDATKLLSEIRAFWREWSSNGRAHSGSLPVTSRTRRVR